MRGWLTAGLVAANVGLLLACLPVPVPRQVSVRPPLTVEVVDADGAPVSDAEVVVRRITVGPPPDRETHRWTATTGPDGAVVLDAIEEQELSMPLMMHGVTFYGWEVCVEHDAGAGTASHSARAPVETAVTLPVSLDPSRSECGWRDLPPPA